MPPLPVDKKRMNDDRKGSLDPNTNQNNKIIQNRNNSSPIKNQKNNLSPSKNRKNIDTNINSEENSKQKSILIKLKNIEEKDEDNSSLGINKKNTSEEVERGSEGVERGSEGGYLSHHHIKVNKGKIQNQKLEKSNSQDKNGENDEKQNQSKNENENENDDNNDNDEKNNKEEEKDEDDNTVKSKAYSVNSRASQNTNNSKRISVGGKASNGAFVLRPQKSLSNIQQIKNAINHVCLAGAHYDSQRAEAIRAVEYYSVLTDPESTPVTQFLVLFYDSNPLSFRGVYTVHPFTGKIISFFVYFQNYWLIY